MERDESNQIKSNHKKRLTQHGFDFHENLMKSIPFYLSTILYFDFDWTFSYMNPVDWHFETDLEYLTTIPIHYLDLLTNVTKTRITETPSFRIENILFSALANPHSIISIHINHYFSCQRTGIIIPHLSPLPYSIRYHKPRISSFWFLL